VWPVFLALTALHVAANAKAVRSLRMTSLNRERTRLLLQHYMRTGETLPPHELAPLESLLPGQQVFDMTDGANSRIPRGALSPHATGTRRGCTTFFLDAMTLKCRLCLGGSSHQTRW